MHAGAMEELLRIDREYDGLELYGTGTGPSDDEEKWTKRAWMSLVGDWSHSPSCVWVTELSSMPASDTLAGSTVWRMPSSASRLPSQPCGRQPS